MLKLNLICLLSGTYDCLRPSTIPCFVHLFAILHCSPQTLVFLYSCAETCGPGPVVRPQRSRQAAAGSGKSRLVWSHERKAVLRPSLVALSGSPDTCWFLGATLCQGSCSSDIILPDPAADGHRWWHFSAWIGVHITLDFSEACPADSLEVQVRHGFMLHSSHIGVIVITSFRCVKSVHVHIQVGNLTEEKLFWRIYLAWRLIIQNYLQTKQTWMSCTLCFTRLTM